MPRAKGGFKTRRRRKKILEKAKGFFGARGRLYRISTEAIDKSLSYAYRDRKTKKREFRSLWIIRINAAARALGLTYSQLITGLLKARGAMNRKTLADMAYSDLASFKGLVQKAKENL